MAVYTKINNKQIKFIEKKYNIGKIDKYSGIKKGIENTNFLLKTQKNKYILTIYEKRVQKKDLPFFVNLMSGLSRLKVKCPVPIKDKKGKYLFNLKKFVLYFFDMIYRYLRSRLFSSKKLTNSMVTSIMKTE